MKNPGAKILIIDDEKQIRTFLRKTLEVNQYEVYEADTAKEGVALTTQIEPSLILLDLELPDVSGLETLTTIRSWSKIPIIILSIRDSVPDIVTLLESGANDYLVKPFHASELIARIRAALRLAGQLENKPAISQFKHLTIDFPHRQVKVNNKPIKLTKTEYEIVRLLALNAGKVLTQQYLLKEVWGEVYADNVEYLRTYISQLRKKLENDYHNPEIILTETGIGYRFCEAS